MLGQCSRRRFPDVEFCKARPRAKPDGLLIVPSPNGHQVQHCGEGALDPSTLGEFRVRPESAFVLLCGVWKLWQS
eukprot:7587763-Pyramimonas_sp.AAC.1